MFFSFLPRKYIGLDRQNIERTLMTAEGDTANGYSGSQVP